VKVWISALLLTVLSACASTPVDLATAPYVSVDRVHATNLLEKGAGKVPVIISYDHFQDIGTMSFTFYVDWEPVAYMREGEQLRIFLTPGRHILSAVAGKRKDSPFATTLVDHFTSDGEYHYRISPDGPQLIPM